jgi:hypothetical protein
MLTLTTLELTANCREEIYPARSPTLSLIGAVHRTSPRHPCSRAEPDANTFELATCCAAVLRIRVRGLLVCRGRLFSSVDSHRIVLTCRCRNQAFAVRRAKTGLK